ncbi:glutamate cyclase domain-containing protein, partial [Neptunomonas sp.]
MNNQNRADDATLSLQIEDALVARNLRGMKTVQSALQTGYYLRAARILNKCKGHVLIGTGFPVIDTFETDGPVGAIALYDALETLGATPVIVCGPPVSQALMQNYRVHEIRVGEHQERALEAFKALYHFQPDAVLSIERPGQAADGGYYNMRGESISARTACFDTFINNAKCPTIGIGDGGN